MYNITWFIYHDARHGIAKARTSEKARVLFVAAAINELLRSDTPESKVDWYAVTSTLNVRGEIVISHQEFKALYDRFMQLEDRGYDADEIVSCAQASNMEVVIPPKRNRKELREYDRCLCKLRHMAKTAFLQQKRRRGIATRYAKSACLSSLLSKYATSPFGAVFIDDTI